jgi:hypothetical protein
MGNFPYSLTDRIVLKSVLLRFFIRSLEEELNFIYQYHYRFIRKKEGDEIEK